MSYIADLRANWRPLLAAFVGLSTGSVAVIFASNIMGPQLLREFGWAKAEYALIGMLGLGALVGLPIAGRLGDVIGVRRTAIIGTVAAPATCIALSRMSGDFTTYFAIMLIQSLLCITTSSPIFTRTVVQHIRRARGLALAIAASGPALTIALGGPIFHGLVAAHGWRTGYLALGAFAFAGGLAAVLLVPPSPRAAATRPPARATAARDYGRLARTPIFWLLIAAVMLTNVFNFILNGQLGVLLLENHVPGAAVAGMISVFAIGVLAGRFLCGLALDRFPAPVVSAVALGLPAIGLFLMASDIDTVPALTFAVLLLGLSFGAEGDVLGFLVARSFDIAIYGTVLGLMVASIPLSGAVGTLVLSTTLAATGSYRIFLIFAGVSTLAGSLLFLLLPLRPQEGAAAERLDALPMVGPDEAER